MPISTEMLLSRPWVCACALLVAFTSQGGQGRDPAAEVQTIINQHWPSSLPRPDDVPVANTCSAVLARSGAEPTRIAAGFWSDGAVLRVLERDASGRFRVAFESRRMLGELCTLEVTDVDRDGAADLLLNVAVRAAGLTWVFIADGGTFRDATPGSGDAGTLAHSALVNAGPIDLDHIGPLEFVSRWREETPDGRTQFFDELFGYRDGRFVSQGNVLVVTEFKRGDSNLLRTTSFNVADDALRRGYVLRLINGHRGGRGRAAGVLARINGQRVAAEKLTDRVEFVDVPVAVPLQFDNELYVEVAGAADAQVTVMIRARPR